MYKFDTRPWGGNRTHEIYLVEISKARKIVFVTQGDWDLIRANLQMDFRKKGMLGLILAVAELIVTDARTHKHIKLLRNDRLEAEGSVHDIYVDEHPPLPESDGLFKLVFFRSYDGVPFLRVSALFHIPSFRFFR